MLVAVVVILLVGPACSRGSAPTAEAPESTPTPLPPPQSLSLSPEPAASPSPRAADQPGAIAPLASPSPAAASPAPAADEKVKVANTGGDGANMRSTPATSGALVKTIPEGTELTVIGPDRDADGRHWRNVRDAGSGAGGWIVADFLTAAPSAPSAASSPAAVTLPPPAPGPAGAPAVAVAPAASPDTGLAGPAARLNDADRAYLSSLQPQVAAIGDAIKAANEQILQAGGKPDIASDPSWRQNTQAVAQSLTDAAAKIRTLTPGPNTGDVQKYASSAADHASAAASGLTSTLDSKDTHALTGVQTDLVRVLADINNMNLSLLNLQ
jgi:uncharacterized protein YgiM (DUF1202 family)